MKTWLLYVLCLILSFTIAGCSDAKRLTQVPAPVLNFEKLYPNPEIREYAQSVIQTEAPDFSIWTSDQDELVSFRDRYKGKPVILEIANTSCSACLESAKGLVDLLEKRRTIPKAIPLVQIFPINTQKEVEDFLKQAHTVPHPDVWYGKNENSIYFDYGIRFTPTFLFIDDQGIIQYVHVGVLSPETLALAEKIAFPKAFIPVSETK